MRAPIPVFVSLMLLACSKAPSQAPSHLGGDAPEWFSMRLELEKTYGYTHAVRVGERIAISGTVSMDDAGNPTAVGDLASILKHYGCTFDDGVTENIFTIDMAEFIKQAAYRGSIYTKHFPAGSWLEVKGLALTDSMIEVEPEVYKPRS